MALSYSQMESYDLQAGWPPSVVPEAAAIEEAESGGDPTAIGPSSGGDTGSWGLFQIQPSAHPGVSQTTDPLQQSKDALAIYQQAGGFSPWSTYPGAASKFLPAAQAAMSGASGTPPSSGSSSSASGPGDAISGLTSAIGNAWNKGLTAGQIMAGIVVLGVGGFILARETDTGKRLIGDAKKGLKVGLMAVPK